MAPGAPRQPINCEVWDGAGHRFLTPHRNAVQFANDLFGSGRSYRNAEKGFGPSGEYHLRLAYCVEEKVINRAIGRMEAHIGT